jgi:hypothetical protein
VTSRSGLLDADGRRVTIQDATAGILLRLAAREVAPPVGSRVRVVGSVGTYYGAPQLSASGPAARLGSGTVSSESLTKAPGAGVEWRLVRIRGTIVDVKRYGQSWRAELALAGGRRVPIVGLARAGIAVDRIREGQQGAIVGLVRRAYPSAKDTRFAVLPRGRADLHLTSASSAPSQTAGASRSSTSSGTSSVADGSQIDSASDTDPEASTSTIEAAEVSANIGRLVRVGGLVGRVVAAGVPEVGPTVVLEDASGAVTLRLPAVATTIANALMPGDLIEATGTVEVVGDDRVVVVVDDPADIVVGGQVADTRPGQDPAASTGSGVPGDEGPQADPGPGGASDQGAAPLTPLMGAAGAGVLLAATLATGAVGARWRRRRDQREASKEATERLVELLSTASEPPAGS